MMRAFWPGLACLPLMILPPVKGFAGDLLMSSTAPFVIETWNTDRGLFQNVVVSLAQSGDGYLWLASYHGWVSRFDGVRFVHYTPAETEALAGTSVYRVFTDHRGDLWASIIGGGLARCQNGEFQRIREGTTTVGGVFDLVSALLYSNDQEILFGAFAGDECRSLLRGRWRDATNVVWETIPLTNVALPLYFADSERRIFFRGEGDRVCFWQDGKFAEIPPEHLPAGPVTWLTGDAHGHIWVSTTGGLVRWRNGQLEDMTPDDPEPDSPIAMIEPSGDGGVWVLGATRLRKSRDRKWVAEADATKLPLARRSPLLRMHGDRSGGVWLVDQHLGVWAVSPTGETWKLGEKEGLPPGLVECWYQDQENNVWLGLYGGGLARVRPREFQVVRPPASEPGQVMSSVCEDAAGRIWLGSVEGGVWRQQNDHFEPMQIPAGNVPLREIKLWPDHSGGVWIGTVQNGAWRWQDQRFTQPFPPEAIGTVVLAGLTDRSGAVWIANGFGLYRFADGHLTQFGADDLITGDRFLALAEDTKGAIWVGTIGGRLWRYDGKRFEKFELPANLPRFRFWSLLADADGCLWVGTMGGGLVRWRDGALTRISEEHGLPNATILQLLDDADGCLWAGTRNGLFSARKSDLHAVLDGRSPRVICRSFTAADGLPSSEFTGEHQPACWRGRDGRLWFSTLKGTIAFWPADLRVNAIPPVVRIEEVRLDDQPWARGLRPLPAGRQIVPPGRHYLEFRFTAPTFIKAERVHFRWRLSGLEANWREGLNERVVKYSFLPPGQYLFEVTARNSDGYWSANPATFAFTVQPFFWQTRSFHIGLPLVSALLVSLAIASVLHRRHLAQMARLEQKRLLEQERARLAQERLAHQRDLERERARIARDLHDDLGASLTQMAWLSETAGQALTGMSEGHGLLAQINQKSREMVRAIDEIVWALNPRNDSLDQLATYVCQYAEQFFRGTGTRCRLDVVEPLPAAALKSDVRHNLFLLLKEALQNVAKHAAAREVWVRIHNSNAGAIFEVEDDGGGFDPDTPSTGDGLANMRRRAATMGASLELRSARGHGTRVRVVLPLSPPPA